MTKLSSSRKRAHDRPEGREEVHPYRIPQSASRQAGFSLYPSDTEFPPPQGAAVRNILDAVTVINELLLSPSVVDGLFTGVANVIARTFHYPLCAIVLFDDEVEYLQVAGINHSRMEAIARRHNLHGPVQRRFHIDALTDAHWIHHVLEGMVYSTSDPLNLARPFLADSKAQLLARVLGIRACMAVPLIARGKLLGAIVTGSARPEPAPYEQSDLLFLAHHTAVALQLWLLYDRAEGRTALLNKLHTLSQTITSTLDLDKLFLEVVASAGQLVNIDFCTINTLTPDKEGYFNRASWMFGRNATIVEGVRFFSVFPADWVRAGLVGEQILVDDLSRWPDVRRHFQHRHAESLAVFPFSSQGQAVGFITVGRRSRGQWSDEDVAIVKQLAEYVSVAFTNAHLYRKATRRAERMAMLHKSGEQLARIHDAGLLFSALYEAVGQALDAPVFELAMRQGEGDKLKLVLRGVDGTQAALQGEPPAGAAAERAAESRDAVYIPDFQTVPQEPEAQGGRAVRSVLSVPLLSGHRVLGAITIESYEPYAYDADDTQTLEILAAQAAVSLDNIRLLQEEAARAAQQSALARSARMIARAETDDAVLTAIAQAVSALTSHSACTIYLADDTDQLVCALAYGSDADLVYSLPMGKNEGLVGKVFTGGQPMIVDDLLTEPGLSPRFKDVVTRRDSLSMAAVPLQTERERIGVLVATNPIPGLYTASHLELLTTLADHTVIALEKGNLLREAKQSAAEQKALVESASAIARLDYDTVLQTIVRKASAIVQSGTCSLLLHDERTNELYWAAGYNNSPNLQALRIPSDKGLVGHIFTSGESLVVADMSKDPRSIPVEGEPADEPGSFIGVPLNGPNGNVGVLVAMSPGLGVFNSGNLELLATFADHATIALYNAYLYNSLQQREAERARLLHQVLTSQEAERRRMAVDIHDGPLQSIGVNLLALDRLRKHMVEGRTESALKETALVRSGMASVVQELRDVISDLRPALLDTQGLVVAAKAHLRNFTEHYGIRTFLHDGLDEARLPATLEITFYRLLQEALTNIRKHADAGDVTVSLEMRDGVLEMCVSDNGRGFEPESGMVNALASGHIGLHSMSERVEMIGGEMKISSTSGQGTSVTFRAPVTRFGVS